MKVALAPDLRSIVALGAIVFDAAHAVARDARLDVPLAEIADRMRGAVMDAEVQAVRSLYRSLGLDPTKTRPSSEALLRRVRKGEPVPRVNALVDICNWCSLELQLPYGLYDTDRIRGDVELRLGRPGEEYPGIRKDVVHVAGRPALVDAEGPFGNPTSDSARTMVTASTARPLAVIFAPREIDPARLAAALDLTAARIAAVTGAVEIGRWTL